jgi:hypothetical protein
MGARGPLPNPDRDYVLTLYRRGELATLAEGAWIAGVTRARVLAWLTAAGIDWKATRQQRIAKMRRGAVASSAGKTSRRPTKAEQRAFAERKVTEFRRKAARHSRASSRPRGA